MKGSRMALVLAAFVLIVSASALWAQDGYVSPICKVISPGWATTIKFDTHIFTLVTEDDLKVGFEKLSPTFVRLTVKAVAQYVPVRAICIQCDDLSPIEVLVGSGGSSIIFNTETGYAEK